MTILMLILYGTFMAATPALEIAHSGAPSLQASLEHLVIFEHNVLYSLFCHLYICTTFVLQFSFTNIDLTAVAIVRELVAQVVKAVNPII